jgi:c-di-GMP-binding flagellar brake protein YcgR
VFEHAAEKIVHGLIVSIRYKIKQRGGSNTLVIVIIILILVSISVFVFLIKWKNKGNAWLQFYVKGKEAGFSNANIKLLKELARHSGLARPAALFWSQAQIDNCIKKFIHDIKREKTESLPANQEFLAKLYDFRNKMEMNRPIYKNGINSSRYIDDLQPIQVAVADAGVIKSKVLSNKPSSISIESPDSAMFPANFNWKQKPLLVYFWRKSDAGYCFETNVIEEVLTNNPPILKLAHSDKLIRTQSRKSHRVKMRRVALLYRVENGDGSPGTEVMPGIKCYLEDLSDSGCAVTAGGTAPAGIRVIVQFVIDKTPLSVSGVVRGVEYNAEKNTSMLHIESDLIPMSAKNKIFGAIFGMITDEADTEYDDKTDGENDEKHKNEREEYDHRHIEDIINWEKTSNTLDGDK